MTSQSQRKYDKGEKRLKHQGRNPFPEIEFNKGNPKYWVGKCPNNMADSVRQNLLDDALAATSGDREIDYVKSLYVVHNDGTIYKGFTSDAGVSYHGFPYRGKLPKGMIDNLRKMAETKKCLGQFEEWVKKHILR